MFCISRCNFKIVISVLIFTFYIIKLICIIIKYPARLVFRVYSIKAYLMEVSEQPRGGTPALNVKLIRDQCHANVSKQRTLLDGVDEIHNRVFRSTHSILYVPKPNIELFRTSSCYSCSKICHAMPDSIKHASSVQQFKCKYLEWNNDTFLLCYA